MDEPTHKLHPNQSQVHALAPIVQRWAELCKQHAEHEPSAALRWYLHGRADAHHMDAVRIREALSPSVPHDPPRKGVAFTLAYEALLNMMTAITQLEPETLPEPP